MLSLYLYFFFVGVALFSFLLITYSKRYRKLLSKYQEVCNALKSYNRNAQVLVSAGKKNKKPDARAGSKPTVRGRDGLKAGERSSKSFVYYPKNYFLIHKN